MRSRKALQKTANSKLYNSFLLCLLQFASRPEYIEATEGYMEYMLYLDCLLQLQLELR